jgi:hypothetical protein
MKSLQCSRNASRHQTKKYDPHLNPIRENPEFQQILKEAEDKFNAEHERVRQWLEENEML